jgi:hypothetical protein
MTPVGIPSVSGERRPGRAASALAALGLALFVTLNVAFVVNRGVCCGDDGFLATAAKNLAFGFGYSTSLGMETPHYEVTPFDPHATSGPTLVLPVSAAIRVLGNRYWVPGAVQVMLWVLLLLATSHALGAVATRSRAAAAGCVFLLANYAVFPFHLEQWYAMLGEIPAALAILLGLVIWAVDPGSRRRSFVAAILMSLAVLTKVLALAYVATFLLGVVGVGLSGGRDRRRLWRHLWPVVLGLSLPIVVFELWKAVSLGPAGYVAQLRTFVGLMSAYGRSHAPISAAEIATRLIVFRERFDVSLPGLLVVAVLGGWMAWKAGRPEWRRLYVLLLAGVGVHCCYGLAFSTGWPRYFLIGVVLLTALLAVPYLALERGAATVLYSGLLVLGFAGTVERLQHPLSELGGRWFAPSSIRASQENVVRFLDGRLDRRPFVSQWWASAADLEYLSKEVLNFEGYQALTLNELKRGVLVVTNSRLDDMGDQAFASLVTGCGEPVLEAAPYAVHECGRNALTERVPLAGTENAVALVVPTSTAPADLEGPSSVTGLGCYLDRVGDRPTGPSIVNLRRTDLLRLAGWVVNEQERRVPARPYVVLQAIGNGAAWYAALTVGRPRADVARVKHEEAYNASGFSASIDVTALPAGEYRLYLLFRDAGAAQSCGIRQRIVLR